MVVVGHRHVHDGLISGGSDAVKCAFSIRCRDYCVYGVCDIVLPIVASIPRELLSVSVLMK